MKKIVIFMFVSPFIFILPYSAGAERTEEYRQYFPLKKMFTRLKMSAFSFLLHPEKAMTCWSQKNSLRN